MSDRAVVDCRRCGGTGRIHTFEGGCLEISYDCPDCAKPPRALVALSEDRQWLVVLDHERWSLLERDWGSYHLLRTVADTGQDAHDVLRVWLEGREA